MAKQDEYPWSRAREEGETVKRIGAFLMFVVGALLVFGAVFTAELSMMGAAEYTSCAVTGLGLMTGAGISAMMEDRK